MLKWSSAACDSEIFALPLPGLPFSPLVVRAPSWARLRIQRLQVHHLHRCQRTVEKGSVSLPLVVLLPTKDPITTKKLGPRFRQCLQSLLRSAVWTPTSKVRNCFLVMVQQFLFRSKVLCPTWCNIITCKNANDQTPMVLISYTTSHVSPYDRRNHSLTNCQI